MAILLFSHAICNKSLPLLFLIFIPFSSVIIAPFAINSFILSKSSSLHAINSGVFPSLSTRLISAGTSALPPPPNINEVLCCFTENMFLNNLLLEFFLLPPNLICGSW